MLKEEILKYENNTKILRNYSYAYFVMSFDEQTDCPKEGKEYSLDVQNYFMQEMIKLNTSKEYKDNIYYLYEHLDELDDFLAMQIKREYKDLDRISRIPQDMLFEHYDNMQRCGLYWEQARETLDYSKFEEELTKLVSYYKEYIKLMPQVGNEAYDVLLDEMEDDFTVSKYDEFFDLIKTEIVPLAQKIIKMPKKYNPILDTLKFDVEKQKEITKIVCEKMGYTNNVGCIRETIHPFTSGAHARDVRITTNYKEELLFSNLFSIMHEVGHALYELGQDTKLSGTNLFGGTSCAIHESQSRFMENYLGRSREFTDWLTPILKDLFKEELKDITNDDVYYYVNYVSDQFTRVEADELTYSIHILIRYEVEKMLFRGEISVSEIDKTFNDLFFKYLGKRPENKLIGCYQDVHWSSSFGYFPTYALGNAFAAQFYYKMQETLDLKELMKTANFKPINEWLDNNIHKYGKTKKNLWIIKEATKEDFNPNYYIKYLKDKFETIYNLK